MSSEIIKVLDHIAKQLGVAIDWTSQNIMPQLMDIFNRYSQLEITKSIIFILINICIICCMVWLSKIIYKDYKKSKEIKNSTIFMDYYYGRPELSCTGTSIVVIMTFLIIANFISIICNIDNLLSWIFVPEIKTLKLLQGMV